MGHIDPAQQLRRGCLLRTKLTRPSTYTCRRSSAPEGRSLQRLHLPREGAGRHIQCSASTARTVSTSLQRPESRWLLATQSSGPLPAAEASDEALSDPRHGSQRYRSGQTPEPQRRSETTLLGGKQALKAPFLAASPELPNLPVL